MAFRQSANDVCLDSAAVRLVHFATASVKFGQIYRLRVFTAKSAAALSPVDACVSDGQKNSSREW
jgi:hypothetical protein